MVSEPRRHRAQPWALERAWARGGALGAALWVIGALVLGGAACGKEVAPPEPIPAEGLPPTIEEMIFGSSRGCRDGLDCASGACSFGACRGMVSTDEPWRVENIAQKLADRIEKEPLLAPRVVATLSAIAQNEEERVAIRGRAVSALGVVVQPPTSSQTGPADPLKAAVVAELKELLPKAPAAVGEVIAATLARLGDPSGVELLVMLAGSERLPVALDATRALGALGRAEPRAALSDEVLVTLLSAVSVDLDLELQRAAIEALGDLGDARAMVPLARHLTAGPEALAEVGAQALTKLVPKLGADLSPPSGSDPLRWDAWLTAHRPPAPPPYSPRGHDSVDDIDLPTP